MSDLLGALRQTMRESEVGGVDSGPRQSRNLENTLEAALEGPPEQGLAAVREQRARLQAALGDLESHLQGMPLEGTAGALVERIRALYRENGEALGALETAVGASDRARVAALAETLREITSRMFECHDAWQAELRLMEQQSSGMVVVPEQYVALYEACDKVARGEIDVGAWRAVLEPVASQVRSTRDRVESGLGGLGGRLAEDPWCEGLAAQVRLGLEESVRGLERMGAYPGSGNVVDMNEGWNALVAGTLRIQKAMHAMSAGQGESNDVVILDQDE
jgi:hypothetical protein